jgi:transposase
MIVVGLDVCKLSVAACVLSEKPLEPRQLYYDIDFLKFEANVTGIKALLALKPDIAVMEPTGVNYSKLWATKLARAGVTVVLVGHTQLRHYRRSHLELPDKDDDADALALACYYWDYYESPRRFVQVRDFPIVRIRELALRLAHLARVQSPIINRIRQDLAWQFPEIAASHSKLMWGWLCGKTKSKRLDAAYKVTGGLGLTESVRLHADRIYLIHEEELGIETELIALLNDSQFEKYRTVFKQFGFGDRVQAILLSQIYPLENYLEDGKPIVKIRKGRKSGKPTKRYLSLRRFMKALGIAPTENSSGDKTSKGVVGGSDLCRRSLWQWVFTRVEPFKNRGQNPILKELGTALDEFKVNGKPIKLARMNVAAKAVRMLFKQLLITLYED